jgi:integrase
MAPLAPWNGGNVARTVRDSNLETRTARGRLKARGKPYYRAIEPGLHLGYRKPLSGAGKWVVRHYNGGEAYTVETIATADDFSDADGVAILSYKQAQDKARDRMVKQAHVQAGFTGPFTVERAMAEYLEWLDGRGKPTRDSRYRSEAFILPKLGTIKVVDLTADTIRKWHFDLAKQPPRLRTKKGQEQKYRKVGRDDETKRRRRASANRTLTILKAALNRSWREYSKAIPSNGEWQRVEPFENVDAARVRYLTVAEAKRLVNACDRQFRPIVEAGLQTGARYGQIAKLTVQDFNPDAGTLQLRTRKGDGTEKVYHCVLTEEGAQFFKRACVGRTGGDLIFTRGDGSAWNKSDQARPMVEACKRAKITPPIGVHAFRHTWASHAVMNGVPLLVVAKNLGHSDTRMVEKHYGHLAPSFVADAIRAGAPRFGLKPGNVRPMESRR